MKFFKIIFLSLMVLGRIAYGHGAEAGIRIKIKGGYEKRAGLINIKMALFEQFFKKYLSDKDFKDFGTHKLYGVIFDPALVEFHPVYPEYKDKLWSFQVKLPKNGMYWFWLQGVQSFNQTGFTVSTRIKVIQGDKENQQQEGFAEVLTADDMSSKIELSPVSAFTADKPMKLKLKFSRTDGTSPELSSYMGSKANIIVAKWPGSALFHAHAVDVKEDPNSIFIDFTEGLPVAGSYRLWIQFVDQGKFKVIPLALKIK